MIIFYEFLPQAGGKFLEGRDFCVLGSLMDPKCYNSLAYVGTKQMSGEQMGG